MKVDLNKNERGEWQADVRMHDGWDAHAVGQTPGRALLELGLFLEQNMPKPKSDLEVLGRILVENRARR